MEKTLEIKLKEQREAIAAQLMYELMPLCVCERCDNLLEGNMARRAIDIVLRDN